MQRGYPGAGSGGSGYIGNTNLKNKGMYGYSVTTSTEKNTKTVSTDKYSSNAIPYYAKSGHGEANITYIPPKSEDNYLLSITSNIGTLEPNPFDPMIQEYTLDIGEERNVKISAKARDEKAIIQGIGDYEINPEKRVSIIVTAENGEEREYIVNVKRKASEESRARNIIIKGLIPEYCILDPQYGITNPENFDPDTNTYTMLIPYQIKNLSFEVEKMNEYETVEGDGNYILDKEENTVQITITAEDGKHKTIYTYNITRDVKSNADLMKLEVIEPEIDIGFKKEKTTYNFSVENSVTELKLNVVPDAENATYEIIGNENFEVGYNEVKVVVTSENGKEKTYTLNVYREALSSLLLRNLTVTNGNINYELSPEFDKLTMEYTVKVDSTVTSVTVNAEAEEEKEEVIINGIGNYNLKTGNNVVEIAIVSPDGREEKYTVNIYRGKNSNCNLESIQVYDAKNNEYGLNSKFEKDKLEYISMYKCNDKTVKIVAKPEESTTTVKLLDNENVKTGSNVKRIMAIAEDGTSKIYTVNVYQTNLDENNYLQNLKIEFEDGHKIEPEFQKEIQEYKVTLPRYYFYKNITITGEAESAKANVIGNGIYTYGNNRNTKNTNPNYTDYPDTKEIIIQVMSESGETREYKITIAQEIDNNAYLSRIDISNEEYALEFNKETMQYEIEVKSVVEELTITGVPESIGAEVTENGKQKLEYGENEIILKVVAEDGITEKNYTIKVIRKPETDQSNYLISITTDKGTLSPEFEKTTLHYNIDVPYETTEINIEAVKEDERAILEGTGKYELNLGENNIYLKVTTEEGGTRFYSICVNRNESTESRLQELEIKNSILKPGFNMDTYEYSLTTTEKQLDFTTIEPVDKNAKYAILGNTFEKQGEYKVIIIVTAPDKKTTSRYILNVTKKENNNNNLASLEVYGYTIEPEFDKNTRLYTLTVENNVQTVVVGATPEEETSTVEGIGEIKLEVGLNKIPVVVTSQTGTKKTYTIEITKKASGDNLIKKLEVNNGTLNEEFQPEENNYTVNIPYSETSVDLSIILNDTTATYEVIGNEDLKVGENEVKIVVTAEDGTKNTYNLLVNRAKINSAYLEELKVKNYEILPEFNKYINKYTLKVNYETTALDLTVIPEDKDATYTVEGNSDFKVGTNTIIITVTSSLGDLEEIYEIEVERQKYVDNYLLMIYTSHRKYISKL